MARLAGRWLGCLAIALIGWGELSKLPARAGDPLTDTIDAPSTINRPSLNGDHEGSLSTNSFFLTTGERDIVARTLSSQEMAKPLLSKPSSLPGLLELSTESVSGQVNLVAVAKVAGNKVQETVFAGVDQAYFEFWDRSLISRQDPGIFEVHTENLETSDALAGAGSLGDSGLDHGQLVMQLANEETNEDDEAAESAEEATEPEEVGVDTQTDSVLDDELGILRVRSQELPIDDELGLIRIQEIDQLPREQLPQPPTPTLGFVTGRASFLGGTNLFRLNDPIDEQVFQVGTGFYLVPKLSPDTDLVLGVEGNLVRYSEFPSVDYNEFQIQAGIRQRISKRVYGQLTWRNQNLYVPNGSSFFNADFIELLLSRRDILSSNTWLDTYYQARVSFTHPDRFSRFSQLGIVSLNYGFTPQFRTSLIYQLFLDDYTQINRYDTYHQVLGQITYDVTPSSRINFFGGVKFGRSSDANINFDEVIYGASFNFNVPIF